MNWTYKDIPSQEGKVAIVTGANSGLGFYTAKGIVSKGGELVMACRSLEKAEAARKELVSEFPDATLKTMHLDLGDLSSVRRFASEFKKSYKKLDLLVNNAGLMAIPYRKTVDGFEMQFGVNHLGHFALTGLLMDLLKKTKDSRVVNVSSAAHNMGEIRFEDIHWEKKYQKWRAYGMSKLANIHFTYEMADRVSDKEYAVKVMAAHPGYSDSNLIEKGPSMKGRNFLARAGRVVNKIFAQSTEMGALPTLYAATAPEAIHRAYYGPRGGMRGYPERVYPNAKKVNKEVQVRLWELSEELTKVSFLNGN